MNQTGFVRRFFGLKWRLANNHIEQLRQHKWVHFMLAILVLVLLVGGGTLFFDMIFSFLMDQQPFGPPLMDRLIKMVLLAFFLMLIFSNLIIMLTTTFISREVEFLMSQPIAYPRLFSAKLGESIVYSSWAFIILSLPFFSALGHARHMPWAFYPGIAAWVLPYLIIPATIGALAALLLSAFCPPRRLVRFSLGLLVLCFLGALAFHRIAPLQLLHSTERSDLGRVMAFMAIGDMTWLPSSWLGRGLLALQHRDWSGAAFWGLALWSTAAMGLVTCDWFAQILYYRGWCNARHSGVARRRRWGLYRLLDRLLAWLSPANRALVTKDLTVFWRDPAQWTNLAIFFAMIVLLIVNLRSAANINRLEVFIPFWKSIVSLLIIGIMSFMLSIMTTRFVYPLLSLEGKQQWIIGLAPIGRTRLVWVKLLVAILCSMVFVLPLALLACWLLDTDRFVTALTLVTVLIMAVGLNTLAVGLGALLPNFVEDNPARIANGVGGTLNAMISLAYIGLTLLLEGVWVQAYMSAQWLTGSSGHWVMAVSGPLWILLHVLMIGVPLSMGLAHWRRMEF